MRANSVVGRGARRLSAVLLCAAACAAVGPTSAWAGSISGTVSAEVGGAPIAGIRVCQYEQNGAVEESCTTTDGAGGYSLVNLPAGSYLIGFSAQSENLPWIDEIYNDRRYSWEADRVALGSSSATAVANAALAVGGSIAGTVTDATNGHPIEGVWVCATDSQGIPGRCSYSGPAGEYVLHGLRSGQYSVEFEGLNRVNYLSEFYANAHSWAAATKVGVTAPSTVSGIDQALSPGAQILGHVSAVGSGEPMAKVFVCAIEPPPGEREDCDSTDPGGNYALRSMEAGTYLVGFEVWHSPFGAGLVAGQWWQGAGTMATATPIALAPPETRTGIDGQLVKPVYGSGESAPERLAPAGDLSPIQLAKLPRHCRKGFRLAQAKKKYRCVRARRHHRRKQHH